MTISYLMTLATAITLTFAACEDLVRHRISNVIVLCALAVGLIGNGLALGWSGLGTAIVGLVVGMGLLLPFHVRGGIAAGDVKLMGALGSMVGPMVIVWAVAFTLISGALLALVYTFWRISADSKFSVRAMAVQAVTWRTGLAQLRKHRFPYALAIAAGTVLAMWQSGAFGSMSLGALPW